MVLGGIALIVLYGWGSRLLVFGVGWDIQVWVFYGFNVRLIKVDLGYTE